MKLSVVVPCYNEEKSVPDLAENFARAFAGEEGVELLLVDNGSTDGTGPALERELAKPGRAFAKKVRVEKNRGYGFGILSGLREARGEALAWTHADLQTDPADVLEAYRLFRREGGNVLIKGFRRNRRPAEKIFSLGMQALASLALGMRLSEINAQPKLFGRELYRAMQDPPEDFSLDLYLLWLAKKRGVRILTVPVTFRDRRFGEAKGGGGGSWSARWKLVRRTFRMILDLRRRLAEARG